jgi:hypothetical protein
VHARNQNCIQLVPQHIPAPVRPSPPSLRFSVLANPLAFKPAVRPQRAACHIA